MSKKHTIELSFKDIEYLQARYDNYRKALDKMTDELCRRLAYMGQDIAKLHFFEAAYDGINDAEVSVEKRQNGYAVKASGKTVLFIEFGTGVHYPDKHPEGAENGMIHGTYGKGYGKNDYWYYTGMPGTAGGELAYGRTNTTKTHGNPANMPMYTTVKELEGEIERIVKEVFDLYQ